jgi:hypothetical protein
MLRLKPDEPTESLRVVTRMGLVGVLTVHAAVAWMVTEKHECRYAT